jgi:hypothetical protein
MNSYLYQSDFTPSKQDKILLYGPGHIGTLTLKWLRQYGYPVCGFMGQNAKKHPVVEGLPCWLPSEVPQEKRAEYLVIVTYQAAKLGEYAEIVRELRDLGFGSIGYYTYMNLPRAERQTADGGKETALEDFRAAREQFRAKNATWNETASTPRSALQHISLSHL